MNFKYKIKIFKKTNLKKNIILGTFYNNKKKINFYILNNILLNKIFEKNFFSIIFLKKKYFVYLKNKFFKNCNNKLLFLEFINIKEKVLINIEINNIKVNKLELINKNKIPKRIKLNIFYYKKYIKYSDFNFKKFKIKNKIICINKKNGYITQLVE